ncbi:MAG: YkuS family protein [Limnochordaceae bacterium]|nr:YkuS family protein [Limnochordaceae bacterium]
MGEPKIIACDDDIMRMRDAIEAAGYRVVPLHEADLRQVAAVVLSGMDDNLLGSERRLSDAPVIEASGMGADDIVAALRNRVAG